MQAKTEHYQSCRSTAPFPQVERLLEFYLAPRNIYAIQPQTSFKLSVSNTDFGIDLALHKGFHPGSLTVWRTKKMLKRTSANPFHSRRVRSRTFHAWSGASLFRYFHRNDKSGPFQPDATSKDQHTDLNTADEMIKRRDELQKLLQQVDRERLDREKTD